VATGPDGSLYIADDQRGRIWRVTFDGEKTAGRGTRSRPGQERRGFGLGQYH
jgi:sugar lactone lactonase YvrE